MVRWLHAFHRPVALWEAVYAHGQGGRVGSLALLQRRKISRMQVFARYAAS